MVSVVLIKSVPVKKPDRLLKSPSVTRPAATVSNIPVQVKNGLILNPSSLID